MRITRIDLLSAATMMGAVYAMLGLLLGGFFSLLSLAGVAAQRGGGAEGLLFGAAAIVVVPLFYGLMGFIGGALGALVYNVAAMVVGGVQVTVDDTSHSPLRPDSWTGTDDPPQYVNE